MIGTLDQDPSAELDTTDPGLDVRDRQAMQVPSFEPIPGREDLVLCFCQGAGDADANRRPVHIDPNPARPASPVFSAGVVTPIRSTS